MSKTHFFITGLPRTRTAWFSNLLTWGDAFCYHEGLGDCPDLDVFAKKLANTPFGTVGDSDPSLSLVWPGVIERFPDARWVIVERGLESATDDFLAALHEDPVAMRVFGANDEMIKEGVRIAAERLAGLPTVVPWDRRISVQFEDLDRERTIRAIWRFCIPDEPWQALRYDQLQRLRVTQMIGKVAEMIDLEALKKLSAVAA